MAKENFMYRQKPHITKESFVAKISSNLIPHEIQDFLEEFLKDSKRQYTHYVISNHDNPYASNALYLPEIFEDLANDLNDDLLILPFSIHGLVIEEVAYRLQFLTNNIYCYHRAEKKISICLKTENILKQKGATNETNYEADGRRTEICRSKSQCCMEISKQEKTACE